MRIAFACTCLLAVAVPFAGRAGDPRPVAASEEFEGRVVGILDGDTVDVLVTAETAMALGYPRRRSPLAIRVRLYGIDAPEKGQPLAREAKRALSALVHRRDVVVTVYDDDARDRLVGTISVDGVELNALLVEQGYAWAFRRYLGRLRGDERYCVAEDEAREAGRGIWRLAPKERVAPWELRRAWREGRSPRARGGAETVESCVAAFGRGG